MPIHTDRTIAANRLDIVLKNKRDKTCLLIDMTIPLDTKTSVKTTEKLTKIGRFDTEFPYLLGSTSRPTVQLLFTWNLSPLRSSKFSFEYLLLPPRSAPEAVSPRLAPKAASRPLMSNDFRKTAVLKKISIVN